MFWSCFATCLFVFVANTAFVRYTYRRERYGTAIWLIFTPHSPPPCSLGRNTWLQRRQDFPPTSLLPDLVTGTKSRTKTIILGPFFCYSLSPAFRVPSRATLTRTSRGRSWLKAERSRNGEEELNFQGRRSRWTRGGWVLTSTVVVVRIRAKIFIQMLFIVSMCIYDYHHH